MSGDPYTTHVPLLARAVMMTKGPVLEFGAGWGSTPLLHSICQGRQLVTYETDRKWLEQFETLAYDNHKLLHVFDWASVLELPMPERIAVAFVDCHPGEIRAKIIRWLRDKCTYVVVHDTETDWGTGADYKYEPEFAQYKYRSDYRFLRPYTTVVSDEKPLLILADESVWTPSREQLEYFRNNGILK